jgi:reductive dehalogenase
VLNHVLIFLGVLGLTAQAFIGLSFLISCIWEKELRATNFALLQFLGMSALLIMFLSLAWIGFFKSGIGFVILVTAYVLVILAALLILLKIGGNPKALEGSKGLIVSDVKRFDERDHVFARNRALRPSSEQYKAYYKEHPEREEVDAQRRSKGGPIGNPGIIDRPYSDVNVAMTLASLNMPHHLSTFDKVKPEPHFLVKKKLESKKIALSPEEATERVKGYARNLGADLVGVTEINPLWVYSHKGEIFNENWEDWGKEINLDHKFAIVFAEEMSFEMIGPAPHTPTVIESMSNYAKGAYISTQLAAFIANLGYSATANHLRYYEANLTPLAVDAGLGELGRLGYLVTKDFGPRVRLGAVTTNLPLNPDKPRDIGVQDFCKICKKCAQCCPSQSIPVEKNPKKVNGTLRWKLNDETCFNYWGKVGTDCNVCMKVCPWSHARTFPHRLIVALISRNLIARRIFSIMDDIFYGKRPKPKVAPKWARFGPG